MRTLPSYLLLFLCAHCSFFPLAAFRLFSLSLILSYLIMMSLGMDFFIFLMLRIHYVSWVCRFTAFPQIWKNFRLFKYFFCPPHPVRNFIGTFIKLPAGILQLTHAFFIFVILFSLCFISDHFYCDYLQVHSSFLLPCLSH